MQATRTAILGYIADHQTGTAKEISQALRMTPANVRHHLNKLLSEGFIEITGTVSRVGRGRPTQIYRLTPKTSQNHSLKLLKLLWEEFIGEKLSKQRASRLTRIARRLIGVVEPVDGGLPQRLYQTVQLLGEMEYEARWEAHADGPQVYLIKCPMASLSPSHMNTCLLDQAILQELVGYPVTQISRRDHHQGGQSYCVFQISSSNDR